MDDIIILMDSKEKLHDLRRKIDWYFQTHMMITMKPNWQVFPTFIRGVDYLGYRSFLNFTLLRKQTCKQFKRKMLNIRRKTSVGKGINNTNFSSVFSYYGWLKSCNSFRLSRKYLEPLKPAIQEYYTKLCEERLIASDKPRDYTGENSPGKHCH